MSGFYVHAESEPVQALEHFRAGTYDLLITDIKIPNMDGLELCEKLSKIDSQIKVCFLTAFDVEYFQKFRQRFPHIPARCFIKKPVSIANLTEMVKQELNRATED